MTGKTVDDRKPPFLPGEIVVTAGHSLPTYLLVTKVEAYWAEMRVGYGFRWRFCAASDEPSFTGRDCNSWVPIGGSR